MGMWGDRYSYHEDMEELAAALSEDVARAKKQGAALVYMGHGNEHLSTGLDYEMQLLMNEKYHEVATFIGLVEGHPTVDEVLAGLRAAGVKKAMLKPLMIVAGDHANNDMAGNEEDSWKTLLEKEGIEVQAILEGLGEKDGIQKRFLRHLSDAAVDAQISLK